MNQGSSNRLIYDNCYFQQYNHQISYPYTYMMYAGYGENAEKCRDKHFYFKNDLVDVESDLKLLNYPGSKCGMMRYNPNCRNDSTMKTGQTPSVCIGASTKNVPIVPAPECCSILYNNLQRYDDPGFKMPNNVQNYEQSIITGYDDDTQTYRSIAGGKF